MLEEYEKKRDLTRSSEPPGKKGTGVGPLIFVVQKHAARRLHHDFRLEIDGVLKSWSVPSGPSPDPKVKRLAVMVEDHPVDYGGFEGSIPKGQYGAGQVIVWDRGDYSPEDEGKTFFDDRSRAEELMRDGLAKGKVSITLRGQKLKGSWALVRMRTGDKNWLLIKHRDEFAGPGEIMDDRSVLSGFTLDELKAQGPAAVETAIDVKPEDMPGAVLAPFLSSVAPMLASLADAPFSNPDWIFEPKLDGYRAIALISEGSAKLMSRRGLDISGECPQITEELKGQPAAEMVLDGEIVALDGEGRPSFQLLQQRLKAREEERSADATPIVFYVFDILYLGGYDLRRVALSHRKELLGRTLRQSERVRLVGYFEEDGKTVFQAAVKQGLEGVIAKRRDSVYESGRRSRNWLKVKAMPSDDFVIGGYTQGTGNRASTFGALLLGYFDSSDRLVYAGHVGSGFDDRDLVELKKTLDELEAGQCPFTEAPPVNAPATWVRPELVAEVKFFEETLKGILREPVFLRLRRDKPAADVRRTRVVRAVEPSAEVSPGSQRVLAESVLEQLHNPREDFDIEVEGNRFSLSNLDKELWPAIGKSTAITKRGLLTYLAKVSPYLLPHLRDRPLTLSRYPDGIHGQHFYQKHWGFEAPEFVKTVHLTSEHAGGLQEYLMCNNLATLIWLGQVADMELHTWFSRISPEPDMQEAAGQTADYFAGYPDFIVFDLDPYIYSGKEPGGAEPELNREAFSKTCEAALWLKETLDSLHLNAFVKTSGRTGLHVYVPVVRQFEYHAVQAAAQTISRYLLAEHPGEVTIDWAVEKRTGKVFLDYNQNVRGKTLATVYSPRIAPEGTVSMPLRWDEVGRVYPTDFTILNAPERLAQTGDLWADILDAKSDLKRMLESGGA